MVSKAYIDVIINLPWLRHPIAASVNLDEAQIKAFARLIPDHDNPIDFAAQVLAARQKNARRSQANYLGQQLADFLVKLIESTDPVSGYYPQTDGPILLSMPECPDWPQDSTP